MEFQLSISPSNEHSGLVAFRKDWLDLLAVQGTLKSLLQHHSSKASILWYSVFFIVQLSHPYMTTGETIALTRWTFVDKVMSLLFNMLSRLVITFLPRSKHLLISWLLIRKQWYIYTMDYYSAIKKNSFESVLMRWMNLEPIIQSEVSQKDKHQYSILTHIYGILKDGNDNTICKRETETQMYRTDFWTLWEKARVG